LRQITLGELRRFRDLYDDVQAEVTDYDEFEAQPQLVKLREQIKNAKSKTAREPLREKLRAVSNARDDFLSEQWSKWWTEVIGTLSEKKLPEDGTLEPWMSETPRGIPGMFQHWRSVPLEESSAGAAEVIAALSQIGQAG
jgi:hypothetical protein